MGINILNLSIQFKKSASIILLVSFALFSSLFAPFATGLISVFTYIISKKKVWIYLFFISFILLFCNMNLNKEIWAFGDLLGIGNDLGWYSTQWFAFSDYPYGFSTIFDNNFSIFINDGFLVKPKISEPVYHSFSYFFSRLTDANYIFYTYAITFFIYLPTCIVIYKILESSSFDEVLIALVLVFFMFYSMKFTNMFNIIRHYCSGSFLIITLYFLYFDKIKRALLFGIIAILTHNAAVAVCAIYAIVYLIQESSTRSEKRKLWSLIVFSSIISLLYLSVYYATFTNYEELNDRGSGYLFKIIDLSIVIISIFAYCTTKKTSIDKLWFYYLGIIILICFMHLSSFLQLRYYAYFDYFRWIGFIYIFNVLIKNTKFKLLLFVLLLSLSLLFLWLRIYISDFEFNGMFHDYFFLKIP